ncbi:hypothetical protein FIBSPDRAFT_763194 [Athelia psychrophila]|uniref:Uncharacterized protein n=1 Tax=Athelia psychrophila TaxID=1759441 RepID=A0A167XIQ7_9AGAM|nr:hypothetical protein FIBSPDRAFT_763194 [Fibularhizoctonia sp. CBS 109695]
MGLFRQKIVPRKFIDLMFNETGKYANWELAKQIQVGDYGEVDRETGRFEKYGNIYDDGLILDKTDKDDPIQGNSLINWNISTEAARQHHFSGTPECNAAGMVGVALAGTWAFSGKRGAVLLMHSPQLWMIPNNKLLNRLVDGKGLEGNYIVSEVYACPAVSLYLSHKGKSLCCHRVSFHDILYQMTSRLLSSFMQMLILLSSLSLLERPSAWEVQ